MWNLHVGFSKNGSIICWPTTGKYFSADIKCMCEGSWTLGFCLFWMVLCLLGGLVSLRIRWEIWRYLNVKSKYNCWREMIENVGRSSNQVSDIGGMNDVPDPLTWLTIYKSSNHNCSDPLDTSPPSDPQTNTPFNWVSYLNMPSGASCMPKICHYGVSNTRG